MEEIKYDIETGAELKRDIRPITITYQGQSKTFDMPGWYPLNNDCEPTFSHEDLKIYDRAIKELKAEVEHLLLPAEIRSIRKSLKLSQIQAGLILGGGKRAFQKYESGDVLPSRAISNLLRILSTNPALLKNLPTTEVYEV
ncbi:MAG: type II toxin-antitoxin system MqsA family antitoxin [Anaerovibrio sp.]|uniref:type II toxin-antitoxin system MqsA family antitoxin n=1 Tax=Anaerovibrio sp. TaxID=1872532 RepID=UPI001B0E09A3|nr:type II toxin-antitoxin system MqsA family antitoxin [Anaerovibrio sp.]MBO5589310.1 type II toxin-antitoxin system MqsA family antitoxin [Anaerovibrio sp.]MBO6246030.1 type II toxin-antitoxin system MqsA family antitoxin [Anaerovibrio sp.]